MREALWRLVAFLVTRESVFAWLRRRAAARPYSDITSADGTDVYMYRGWVFNPYGKDPAGEPTPARRQWLPSVRLHRIMRPDGDRHMHDHPWNARTVVLKGFYVEERPLTMSPGASSPEVIRGGEGKWCDVWARAQGYTGRLLFGEYHRITKVSDGGVWTLFFTWRKRGTWGFLVDGHKVPWREYLGIK